MGVNRIPAWTGGVLLLLLAALPSHAANPASGKLTESQRVLSYRSGPFALQNNSQDVADPACTGAAPASDCDDYRLTVDLPPEYYLTHPRDLLFISAKWTVANFDAYGMYVLDEAGNVLDWSRTERDPIVVSLPAVAGTYTVRLVALQPSPEFVDTTVSLVADQTARAPGAAPRFIMQPTPPGMGDGTGGGEASIGYNPRTQTALSLSYTQTLRTKFPDAQDPALPECCSAQWTDASDSRSQVNTNDPILFTDPVTGRTFVSQLQIGVGQSIFLYSDDDGASWTLSPSTINGGADHQSVGGGPYSARGMAGPTGAYPHAVYYCSQSVAAAFCTRSDDGGDTFAKESVLVTAADCDGYTPYIHGHVRVAPDGTVYVPLRNCGGNSTLIVSDDSGDSWQVRRLPGTTAGDSDPSVGISTDGTLYFCYLGGDGHAHATVSKDRGLSWFNDRDLGYAQGIVHAVFPQAVAGDPDRAACAFLGSTTRGGDFQNTTYEGIWYPYIAMTYDGGRSWHTVNATPDDPVQGRGGIALGGATAIENRNLLDFNEITLDEKGRVLFAFNDGCVGACVVSHKPGQISIPTFVSIITDVFAPGAVPGEVVPINIDAKPTILRQSGGRSLYAAFDDAAGSQFNSAGPIPPAPACLNDSGREGTTARLVWRAPDNGGADITGYRVYRGLSPDALGLVATTGPTVFFDDTINPLVATYYYKVTALNSKGEGAASNVVPLSAGALPVRPNSPPIARLAATPTRGAPPLAVTLDAGTSSDADGDALKTFVFDFADGSDPVTQSAPKARHTYAALGSYTASVKVVDAQAQRSQNAGLATIDVAQAVPDPFTFIERTSVATGVYVTSEARVLGGFAGTLPVSVAGGQYRLNAAAWSSADGQVVDGDTIAVRHISSSEPGATTETLVTVGGYTTTFRSTTTTVDRTPDAFGFATQASVPRSTLVESGVITPAGYNTAVAVTAGPSCEYRVNGGAWTAAAGTMNPGDTLQTRHTSASTALAYTRTYLKVGGVTGYFSTRTQ